MSEQPTPEPSLMDELKKMDGVVTIGQIAQHFETYLEESDTESNGFLVGLDVKPDQFQEAFQDFMVYLVESTKS